MLKRKPVIVRTPMPTIEEVRMELGMSKKEAMQIRKIMETPVSRRKKRTFN
jgi:hypothetical protein